MRTPLIIIITIVFCLIYPPPLKALDLKETLKQRLEDNESQEALIIQDIFRLDAAIQKNITKTQELSSQLATIRQELQEARIYQAQVEARLQTNRESLNNSLRFFYTYGASPVLTSAFTSTGWSDLIVRWELTSRLANFFLDSIRNQLQLQALVREKSNLIATKEKELQQAQENMLATQKMLTKLKQEQQAKLASLQKQHSNWSKDLLALEKAWSSALPSLQYLLQQLPALPWQQLEPDNIKIDYAAGKVVATFTQASLNSKLFSSEQKMQEFRLVLAAEGLCIPGPDFEVKGTLQVDGPHQLIFIPRSVSFAGIPLERSTWNELLSEEKLKLNLPPPIYGLQFKDISLNPGHMVLVLGWQ